MTDFGRDSRLSQAEPATRLGPSGFDPARIREVLTTNLTDEQIEQRTIDCADTDRYREVRAIEVDSFLRGMDHHDAQWMLSTVLRNAALYSPWYGSAHHLFCVAADALDAALQKEAAE